MEKVFLFINVIIPIKVVCAGRIHVTYCWREEARGGVFDKEEEDGI